MESVMYRVSTIRKFFFLLLAAVSFGAAHAAPAKGIDEEATVALNALYAQAPGAKALGEKAKAVLVFPSVYKAALLVGGQGGNGAMFQDGRIVGHYNIGGAAVGFEGGAQIYSYALFLMSDEAVERLNARKGFELGVDPNIVVVDAAAGTNISTTTGQRDVYGYVYNASGLMGGVSLQGLKITRLSK
jgi:lipid-binding SYLF domain-containing protein